MPFGSTLLINWLRPYDGFILASVINNWLFDQLSSEDLSLQEKHGDRISQRAIRKARVVTT